MGRLVLVLGIACSVEVVAQAPAHMPRVGALFIGAHPVQRLSSSRGSVIRQRITRGALSCLWSPVGSDVMPVAEVQPEGRVLVLEQRGGHDGGSPDRA